MSRLRMHFPAEGKYPTAVILALTLACLWLTMPAFGQTDQGAITGVVTDQTGAAIPNAQVTLTSNDTGLVLTQTTSGSGVYTFSPVKIGSYKIAASASGFNTVTRDGLQLQLQQRLEANLQLFVGAVNQQIEVTAAPPVMQTEEASVGQEFTSRTINDTPLSGKN